MLRVMIVDDGADSHSRSLYLRLMLEQVGYAVVSEVFEPRRIYDAVKTQQPDVIIVDTDSPSRDTLEHIAILSATEPRPIVMFASDRGSDTIREAVQAGVSAYIVDGLAEFLFPIEPDYVLTAEREVFRRAPDGTWQDFGDWNARCAVAHDALFAQSGRLLADITAFLATVPGAQAIHMGGPGAALVYHDRAYKQV